MMIPNSLTRIDLERSLWHKSCRWLIRRRARWPLGKISSFFKGTETGSSLLVTGYHCAKIWNLGLRYSHLVTKRMAASSWNQKPWWSFKHREFSVKNCSPCTGELKRKQRTLRYYRHDNCRKHLLLLRLKSRGKSSELLSFEVVGRGPIAMMLISGCGVSEGEMRLVLGL